MLVRPLVSRFVPSLVAIVMVGAPLDAQELAPTDSGAAAARSSLVATPVPAGAALRASASVEGRFAYEAPPVARCSAGRVARRSITEVPKGALGGAVYGFLFFHVVTMGWSDQWPPDASRVRRGMMEMGAVLGAAVAVKDLVDECRGRPPYIVRPVRK